MRVFKSLLSSIQARREKRWRDADEKLLHDPVLERIEYLNTHEGFYPNMLVHVKHNGTWYGASFLRFDVKNGKDVIYVQRGDKVSFYAYPSALVSKTFPKD